VTARSTLAAMDAPVPMERGERWHVRLRLAGSAAVLSLGALLMLLVAIPTAFQARRLYSEVIGRAIGRGVLRVWGIRLVLRGELPAPRRQVVYVSNHSSTIDVFALIALGLPRTRFFLSGFLRRVVPIGIIGQLIRVFWTVRQEYPAERTRIFRRADAVLRRTGDSVYLSPEGMRVTSGEIGPFNRGAFHLATSLRAPIVPLYLRIPRAVNPGRGYAARAGTVEVHVLPAIETAGWRVEDVARNRDRVRDLYLRVHRELADAGTRP
jgi:1-acyl-sn-glycerol-3-phosphate acyltransferase